MNSLEELVELGEQYGNITIFQCAEDRTYSCIITVQSISWTELKASSGFGHKSLKIALIKAIEKAQEVVKSLKQEGQKEYKLIEG